MRFVQVLNPRSKEYIKIDKQKAKILGRKRTPYKNVPIAGKTEQLTEKNNRVELDLKNGGCLLRWVCCGCGLTHMMSFAMEDNNKLGIAVERE